MNGHFKIVEILMKKYVGVNIDLNIKDDSGMTGFHLACIDDELKVTELLVQKSFELNIDLNAKDVDGYTAFQFACKVRTS